MATGRGGAARRPPRPHPALRRPGGLAPQPEYRASPRLSFPGDHANLPGARGRGGGWDDCGQGAPGTARLGPRGSRAPRGRSARGGLGGRKRRGGPARRGHVRRGRGPGAGVVTGEAPPRPGGEDTRGALSPGGAEGRGWTGCGEGRARSPAGGSPSPGCRVGALGEGWRGALLQALWARAGLGLCLPPAARGHLAGLRPSHAGLRSASSAGRGTSGCSASGSWTSDRLGRLHPGSSRWHRPPCVGEGPLSLLVNVPCLGHSPGSVPDRAALAVGQCL